MTHATKTPHRGGRTTADRTGFGRVYGAPSSYSPTFGEGLFSELPLYGVLGSRATRGSHGQCLGAHLGEPAHGRGAEAASTAGDDRRSVGEVHRSSYRMSYAAVGGPNQVLSASGSPRSVPSLTQATYPSGRINTAVGAVTAPSAGSSHLPTYSASISRTRSAHGAM